MEDPNLGQFTDDLANMMQGSIEQETGSAGLLDLTAMAEVYEREIQILEDYQHKLVEYRGSVENALRLVDKRIRAVKSGLSVLKEPDGLLITTEDVLNKTVRAVKKKAA